MEQTRLISFIEVNVNVFLGFIVSLLFWSFIVVPVWDLPVTMEQNLVITGWFTVLAVIRGYIVRRFFSKRIHESLIRILKNYAEEK